jgi:hypothetical protein
MAVLRRIAAAYVATFKAHTQMDPGIAGLETVFATLGRRLYSFDIFFGVFTGRLCHRISPLQVYRE